MLTAAACAGNPAQRPTPFVVQPPGSIQITMTDYRFTPDGVSTQPGDTTLFLVNSGSAGHDLTVLGLDGKRLAASSLVPPGGTGSLTLKSLGAGSYHFFCSQPGHEELGMTGELEVGT